MITIFNRKELVTIASQQKLFRIREALANTGISSHIKTHGILGFAANRSRGVPCVNQDAAYTYTIFVHRDDYDRALAAIQPVLRR